MRRVWMVFAAVVICWGVQAQEGFDAKMRRAGLVDVLAVDSTLRVKLMYSAPDNFMRRDVYGDLETAYLLPHFARKVAAAQRLLRERRPGWRLLVCDAARPVSVQRQMYELVKGTPNQVYVADGTRGGRHNYGVAVDVTLLDETGAPVDMGTPVDFFGDEAHTGDEPALAAEGRISAEAWPQPPVARKRDARSGAGALPPRVVALRGADGDVRSPDPV